MNRTVIRLILFTTLFLFAAGGIAAADGVKEWQVPTLGIFRVPQEFMAAEFPDLKKMIDSQKDKLGSQLDSQAELPIPEAKEKLNPDRIEFSIYQLTMNDGQAYHLAWLVAMRDKQPLDEKTAVYFDKALNIEQRAAAIMMQDTLAQNLDQMQYNDPKTGFGIKVLEFDSFDFIRISGKQGYAGGLRFLMNYQDFVFPMYMRGYVFSAQRHAAAILLITTDSERTFWTPVLNSIIPSLRAASAKNK